MIANTLDCHPFIPTDINLMKVFELYLLCLSLLVITHHGETKPTDIHIHLHGIGDKAPTEYKPRGETKTESNQMDEEIEEGWDEEPMDEEPGDEEPVDEEPRDGIPHRICRGCWPRCPPSCFPPP